MHASDMTLVPRCFCYRVGRWGRAMVPLTLFLFPKRTKAHHIMRHLGTLVAVSYCAACAANEAEPVVVQLHTLDSETNGVQFLEPVTVPGAIGLMPEPSIDSLSKGALKSDVFEVVPDEIVDLHDISDTPSKVQTVEVKSSRRADAVASGISSKAASSVDPVESSEPDAAEISDADADADDDTAVVLSAGDSDKSVATVQDDSDKTVAVVQDDSDRTVAVAQDDSDKTVATVPEPAELAVTETVPETVPETSSVPTEEAAAETVKKSTLFSRAASRVTAAVEFVRWLTALIQKWFSTAMSLLALAVAVWAWRRLAAPATSSAAPAVVADEKAAVSTATGESHKAGTIADTPDIWVPPQLSSSTQGDSRSVTFPKEEYMPGVQEETVPGPPALPARRSSGSSSSSSSSGSGARKAPAVVPQQQQQQRSPQQQQPLLAKQQVVPGRVSVLVAPGAPLHEALHQSQLSESAKSLLTGTATTSPLLKGSNSTSSSARSARHSSLQALLEQDAAQQRHAERSVPAPVAPAVAVAVANDTTAATAAVPESVVVAAPAAVAAPVATEVAEPAAAAVVPAAAVTVQGKSVSGAVVSPNSVSSSESKSSITNRLVPPPEDIDYGVRSPPSLAAPTWAGQLKASHLNHFLLYIYICMYDYVLCV
jgi:hypothetical protein